MLIGTWHILKDVSIVSLFNPGSYHCLLRARICPVKLTRNTGLLEIDEIEITRQILLTMSRYWKDHHCLDEMILFARWPEAEQSSMSRWAPVHNPGGWIWVSKTEKELVEKFAKRWRDNITPHYYFAFAVRMCRTPFSAGSLEGR